MTPKLPPVLQAKQLGKEYRIYDSPRQRLLALLFGAGSHRSHWALKSANFSLHPGQCLGVVGSNGAGKSTLLKLITGTLRPSHGQVQRIGRITAILELGAGFHPEFSGRDNLYFNASLIGISAQKMRELEAEIIDFAELHEAIDRPVKTYSSGMTVRLAFALVTALEPEVLIIDEALAVGDQRFQKKCIQRIDAFRRNGCTILFCSHSLYHVRQLCDVVLWIDHGEQRAFGATEDVLGAYEAHLRAQDNQAKAALLPGADALTSHQPLHEHGNPGAAAALVSVELENLGDGEPPLLESTDLVVTVTARMPIGETPHFGIMLEQAHGVGITSVGTLNDGVEPLHVGRDLWRAKVRFSHLALHTGEYVVSAFLFDSQGLVVYEEWLHCAQFRHVFPLSTPGLVRLPHQWENA